VSAGGEVDARRRARAASLLGREVGRRPSKKIKAFFFIFSINSPKSSILSTKKSFSKGGLKIKVV
jgi:hypothetical protein